MLDTLILTQEMGTEYERAKAYVKDDLRFDIDGNFNAFETTIRVLGGLLSAYHLAGNEKVFLDKAIELGTRLLPIFNSVSLPPLNHYFANSFGAWLNNFS